MRGLPKLNYSSHKVRTKYRLEQYFAHEIEQDFTILNNKKYRLEQYYFDNQFGEEKKFQKPTSKE